MKLNKLYCGLGLTLLPALMSAATLAADAESSAVPIAQNHEKFLGNIHSDTQLPGFTDYWNQVVPENAGKWGVVEAVRDVMVWTELDKAYNLAKDNNLPFRMHVMIWGNQQPAWIESLTPEEQLAEIVEWFSEVSARYPDSDFVEIVNEPINDAPAGATNGKYIDALGGTGETGWDWIITAFEMGRDFFPNSKLMINEYSVTNGSNIEAYLEIIGLLQERDLIDAIGVQAHAFSTNVAPSVTKANLDRLAATGLPIYVTEMDVDSCPDTAEKSYRDTTQLANYQRIFPAFWEHPAVEGVTLWGWKPGLWRETAYLVNSDGTERPALAWLRNYVESGEVGTRAEARCSAPVELDLPTKDTGGGSTHPLMLLGLLTLLAGALGRKIRLIK